MLIENFGVGLRFAIFQQRLERNIRMAKEHGFSFSRSPDAFERKVDARVSGVFSSICALFDEHFIDIAGLSVIPDEVCHYYRSASVIHLVSFYGK
jgi:hypothetical protein